ATCSDAGGERPSRAGAVTLRGLSGVGAWVGKSRPVTARIERPQTSVLSNTSSTVRPKALAMRNASGSDGLASRRGHNSALFVRSKAISRCEATRVTDKERLMRLTRPDSIAAASAALFLGLLPGESMLVLAQGTPIFEADPPKQCPLCDAWNEPLEPFRIFGDTYYVGTTGLSAVLIASDEGHVLLDGGLPQSAALIDRSIRALGFSTEDIRLIVNSHAHYDHA